MPSNTRYCAEGLPTPMPVTVTCSPGYARIVTTLDQEVPAGMRVSGQRRQIAGIGATRTLRASPGARSASALLNVRKGDDSLPLLESLPFVATKYVVGAVCTRFPLIGTRSRIDTNAKNRNRVMFTVPILRTPGLARVTDRPAGWLRTNHVSALTEMSNILRGFSGGRRHGRFVDPVSKRVWGVWSVGCRASALRVGDGGAISRPSPTGSASATWPESV